MTQASIAPTLLLRRVHDVVLAAAVVAAAVDTAVIVVVVGFADEDTDELYSQALGIIKSEGKASTSFLQRKLQIGYNRAARIIDQMEEKGVVSKANHVGKREVL